MRRIACGVLLTILATGSAAQDLRESMLTDAPFCFARVYDKSHLATHPQQRVTAMSISPHPEVPVNAPDGMVLLVRTMTRASPEILTAVAYCEVGTVADCGLEGDAGTFRLDPRGTDAVVLTVGRYGMTFEGATQSLLLSSHIGDDRSFRLDRAGLSACQ
jgi:hypothetical protein